MKDKKKVGLVKRIAAVVCALMMVVGCLSSSMFYASDYIFTTDNSNFVLSDVLPLDDYPEYIVYYENPWGFYCILGRNKSDFSCSSVSSGTLTVSCSQGVVYKSSDGSNWVKHSSSPGFNIYANKTTGYKICYSTMDLYSSEGILVCSSSTSSAGGSYNSSLGYLQNVTSKRMNIHNDEDNYQSKYKFTFDTTSSTGVDLSSGDYVVRLYEQTSIYIDNIWQPFDTPKVHIGDFNASIGSLSFNISEALAKTDAETGEIDGYNFLTIALNNYVRADTYWLQIFNKETGEYGGFVQMKNNPKLPGQFTTSTVHGAEDDISGTNGTDTGGYVDKIVDTNIGTGTNYEDAELNADKGDLGDSGELVDQLDDMVSTVMAVPQIFAKLFSFLPDWCLNLFGASVGLAGVILVWKAARG